MSFNTKLSSDKIDAECIVSADFDTDIDADLDNIAEPDIIHMNCADNKTYRYSDNNDQYMDQTIQNADHLDNEYDQIDDQANDDQLNDDQFDDNQLDDDQANDKSNNEYDQPNDQFNNQSNDTKPQPERKKRGLPKSMLINQQKHIEALERQQRMLTSKKSADKNKKMGKKNADNEPKKHLSTAIPPGTRRVIVAGKVKYIPTNTDQTNTTDNNIQTKLSTQSKPSTQSKLSTQSKPSTQSKSQYVPQPEIKYLSRSVTNVSDNNDDNNDNNDNDDNDDIVIPVVKKQLTTTIVPIKSTTAAPTKSTTIPNKSTTIPNKSTTTIPTKSRSSDRSIHSSQTKRVPGKYAKQMENDVKKQTVKSIRNFSDLRRVRALQDIAPDTAIDANKASIVELRKIRIEQRKEEQLNQKKKSESNKRETAIQEILNNDKMSKFGKAVAIKNLSVNSRTKKSPEIALMRN